MLIETNRAITPAFKLVEKIEMIKAQEQRLRNNIPVYVINAGTQELVKIEFLFSAGIYYQQQVLQATTVNTMLEEGTSKMTAEQIADAVDFYGAFLETGISQDSASVVLYTLNKHLDKVLPIIEEIIKDAVFAEKELEIHLKNKLQKFIVNNQKVATIARKKFTELLFGSTHPYGVNVEEIDFDKIKRNHLIDFYKKHYTANSCKIIIAGKVDESLMNQLDKYFGGNDWLGKENITPIPSESKTSENKIVLIEKSDALQSAIRIGKLLFNKTHADYQKMLVLNTIYGGYFGSRLMSNIREDKGYTYGIGSGISSMQHGGYFFISTEVGVDVCSNALKEIYFEMDRLREELVTEDELQLVKNYILGTFLRSVDGPFSMAERFKGILEYGLGYDYFDRYFATIRSISPSDIRELANQYLDKNSMIELVVGKKS